MGRPVLLDLFCGAGGAAMGYHRAGFEVVGVDINPQPHYPFQFHEADALALLGWLSEGGYIPGTNLYLSDIAAIHASPPCQAYSDLKYRHKDREYPDLIAPVREMLKGSGLLYVIENVVRAPLAEPVILCGTMFSLGTVNRDLQRHRKFESNVPLMTPGRCEHDRLAIGVYGHGGGQGSRAKGRSGSLPECREAMGIDWMSRAEISQAIPPAYTEYVGGWLMAALEVNRELAHA